ncbi:malignant T cell-amplified sequence 1-like protein [Cokeromyces recurvatus]|uniref:malignant T cell-amplified sequence 1-like protein n=1 Tax=Cokeromyces recurvatus TaxID=90255 RepID=UPI00221E4161|nr:malignant T cell-amplified sequence 1-like protein [Cokeromyces recurvatus]KAI7907225.1 malignant T cell-amplified sequence 1-like protein [Cokeromyces recurvatus]
MFKKFNFSENIAGQSQLKSSVQRNIRAKLNELYPTIESVLEELMPKKTPIIQIKGHDHINFLSVNGEILFFQHFDGPFLPTLALLHKYPDMLPKLQVDRGAIKFVLSGANIMCPGLTSKGARMDVDLPAGAVAAIMAEGKENALAIGLLKMSTQEIKMVNKGIGVENIHYLTDPLYKEVIHI